MVPGTGEEEGGGRGGERDILGQQEEEEGKTMSSLQSEEWRIVEGALEYVPRRSFPSRFLDEDSATFKLKDHCFCGKISFFVEDIFYPKSKKKTEATANPDLSFILFLSSTVCPI